MYSASVLPVKNVREYSTDRPFMVLKYICLDLNCFLSFISEVMCFPFSENLSVFI